MKGYERPCVFTALQSIRSLKHKVPPPCSRADENARSIDGRRDDEHLKHKEIDGIFLRAASELFPISRSRRFPKVDRISSAIYSLEVPVHERAQS